MKLKECKKDEMSLIGRCLQLEMYCHVGFAIDSNICCPMSL